MIGYIKGKILNLAGDTAIILTASGVGFEVILSGAARSALSGKSEGEVYTYLQTREDGASLFGFVSQEEKNMFLQLITVSGVGPKMGITVLSGMNMNDLAAAIATSDVKRLSAIKGLGKKTAERIILELREKVALTASEEAKTVGAPAVVAGEADEDAVVALMTLGFTRAESVKAIARARSQGAAEIEDIIRVALQGM